MAILSLSFFVFSYSIIHLSAKSLEEVRAFTSDDTDNLNSVFPQHITQKANSPVQVYLYFKTD